jgi:TRAP transporter TAXI family solute receptor
MQMLTKSILGLALAAGLAAPAAAREGPLRLGTATEGGVWYVLGNGFAQVIGEALGTTVTPVTTAGSMENSRRLSAGGDLDLGLALATSIANGVADGTVDLDAIRAIGAGHGNFMQVVVRDPGEIGSWTDAFGSGHVVGVGEPGSASFEVTTGAIRAVTGSLDDIRPARLGHQAQADALKNGDLEVMVVTPGYPTGAVVDVTSSVDATLLSGSEEEIAALQEAMPFMATGTIPAEVYEGQAEPVTTVILPSLMFVTTDMADDAVYEITKALYESPDALSAVHSNGAQWVPENAMASREFLEAQGVTYHPGAVRYFEEIGIW